MLQFTAGCLGYTGTLIVLFCGSSLGVLMLKYRDLADKLHFRLILIFWEIKLSALDKAGQDRDS